MLSSAPRNNPVEDTALDTVSENASDPLSRCGSVGALPGLRSSAHVAQELDDAPAGCILVAACALVDPYACSKVKNISTELD